MEIILELTGKQLEFLFGLVQFYGESRQCLRNLRDDEEYILRKKRHNKNELETLSFIKKQKAHVELALKAVALELDEKHGFCMPGVTGWRTSDQDRFFTNPLFSATQQSCCCPKPNP